MRDRTIARRIPARAIPRVLENPSQIFGERLAFWLRAEDFTPASWPDVTGNLTLAQATAANQLSASTVGVQPTALSDGTDDYMVGDMTTPFAASSRPWIAMLMRLASDPGSGSKTILNVFSVAANLTLLNSALATNSSVRKLRASFTKTGPAAYTFQGPAADITSFRLCEYAWPNAATGKFTVDETAYNTLSSGTADTAGLLDVTGQIEIANNSIFSVGVNARYRDIFAVIDQPNAAELAKARAWVGSRRSGS